MKNFKFFYLLIFVLFSLAIQNIAKAQDEECCEEDDKYGREGELTQSEWSMQMEEFTAKKKELQEKLIADQNEIINLKFALSSKALDLKDAEYGMYTELGLSKSGLDDFKKKFEETEKKILNRTGTPADARKFYFTDISASKAKCLPDYYGRYLTMKQKLEAWEKESAITSKESQYSVIKGDCLWRIAGKTEIYNNPKFWPKIWEANEEGVISAPPFIPKKITNPNLIYPGQVIRIPSLTDDDLTKMKDNTYVVKNIKKLQEIEKTEKDKKKQKKSTKNKKKDIKKVDKKKVEKKKVDIKKPVEKKK